VFHSGETPSRLLGNLAIRVRLDLVGRLRVGVDGGVLAVRYLPNALVVYHHECIELFP
jgi:hypothetical protein